MFVRRKVVRSSGREYVYLQLVENLWVRGKVRQKVLLTLGREDRLDPGYVDKVVAALGDYTERLQVLDPGKDLLLEDGRDYGSVLVLERLWRELGIDVLIRRLCSEREFEFDVEAAIRGMVFGRCLDPSSKRGTWDWLRHEVDFGVQLKLHHLYRALDVLYENKEAIEAGLFGQMRDLFSLDVSVVFYDTTLISSYGTCSELIRYSRNGEPEFLLTLALSREGLPFAHELHPGNTADVVTVSEAVKALKRRFSIRECIFVADRGVMSRDNLELLRQGGLHYIVGCPMRRAADVRDEVLSRPGRYRQIEDIYIKRVVVDGRRYIICYNPLRAAYDRNKRQDILEELEADIAELDPRSKEAARLIAHRTKGRYLERLEDGTLRLNKRRIAQEARYDGKYVIRTSHPELSDEEVVRAYRNLALIERSFRSLKSLEEISPVYHWRTRRIKAHVHVCVLAHLLERYLEKRLREGGLKMTAEQALRHLGRMKSVTVTINREVYRMRTEAPPEVRKIFKALGYRIPPRVQSKCSAPGAKKSTSIA